MDTKLNLDYLMQTIGFLVLSKPVPTAQLLNVIEVTPAIVALTITQSPGE
jgi:hypothetical protein